MTKKVVKTAFVENYPSVTTLKLGHQQPHDVHLSRFFEQHRLRLVQGEQLWMRTRETPPLKLILILTPTPSKMFWNLPESSNQPFEIQL